MPARCRRRMTESNPRRGWPSRKGTSQKRLGERTVRTGQDNDGVRTASKRRRGGFDRLFDQRAGRTNGGHTRRVRLGGLGGRLAFLEGLWKSQEPFRLGQARPGLHHACFVALTGAAPTLAFVARQATPWMPVASRAALQVEVEGGPAAAAIRGS